MKGVRMVGVVALAVTLAMVFSRPMAASPEVTQAVAEVEDAGEIPFEPRS